MWVVKNVETRLVKVAGEPLLADRHSYARRDALSEWAGGGLDTRNPMILGVPWCLAVELAEAADVIEQNRGPAHQFVVSVYRLGSGQVQHGPKQHRGVPIRKHEPIPVGPDRVLGVEAHHAVPDRINHRCERHRCSRMSRIRLLHRVD